MTPDFQLKNSPQTPQILTRFDLLPNEIVEKIYFEKHKLEMKKVFHQIIITKFPTLNVKGNRKIVSAEYSCGSEFKIPDNVDLNNKQQVKSWGVKWNTLYIEYVDGIIEDIQPVYDAEIDYKYPTMEEIGDCHFDSEDED